MIHIKQVENLILHKIKMSKKEKKQLKKIYIKSFEKIEKNEKIQQILNLSRGLIEPQIFATIDEINKFFNDDYPIKTLYYINSTKTNLND